MFLCPLVFPAFLKSSSTFLSRQADGWPFRARMCVCRSLGGKGASDTRDESEAVFGATADHMYTSKRRVGFGGANKRLGGRRGDDATAATRCLHFVSRSNFQDSDGDDAAGAGGDRVIITFVGCRPRVRRTTGSSRAISTCTKAAFVYFSHSLVPCQSHCILPFLKSHSRCPRGQGIEEEGYYRNECLIQPPASFELSHTPTGEWRASEVFIH